VIARVDATALYYTFSTIAQTLAGALAVLVAFTLFGLAKLDEAIRKGQAELLRYSQWPKRWEALRAGGLKGLEDDVGTAVTQLDLRIAYHEASVSAGLRPGVLHALRIALAATVVDIGLCFIALPFTPNLASLPSLAWSTAGATITLGIVCLWLYWRLIAAMVDRPVEIEAITRPVG
jgi:hypothetical protein